MEPIGCKSLNCRNCVLCQYLDNYFCPDCPQCAKTVVLSIRSDSSSKLFLDFNINYIANNRRIQGIAVLAMEIEDRLKDMLLKRISADQSKYQIDESNQKIFYFFRSVERPKIHFQNFLLVDTTYIKLKQMFSSTESLENYLIHRNISNSEKIKNLSTSCSGNILYFFELLPENIGVMIDGIINHKLQIYILHQKSCSIKEQIKGLSFYYYSKNLSLVIFSSILQNILFSMLNNLDVLSILYYFELKSDPQLKARISELSSVECQVQIFQGSLASKMNSNSQIKLLFGLQNDLIDLSGESLYNRV